jgi:tetratricopeptide (TPR) repeat protein
MTNDLRRVSNGCGVSAAPAPRQLSKIALLDHARPVVAQAFRPAQRPFGGSKGLSYISFTAHSKVSNPARSKTARLLLLAGAAFLALTARSSSQPALETKQGFVSGLIQFMETLPGTYGDEGVGLTSALEAMGAGLRRWDAGLRAYADAMTSQLKDARPGVAVALRLPLGAVYLERGRFEEALREFATASELDPEWAEPYVFRGLAFEATGRLRDAGEAFQAAWRLDPKNPAAAYQAARHELDDSGSRGMPEALEALLTFQQQRIAAGDPQPVAPFVRIELVEERGSSDDPVFAPARYADGFKLLDQYKLDEALARLRDAAATDPLVVDAALLSGMVAQSGAAMRRGDVKAALQVLEPAVERVSSSSEAHRVLGMAYWMDEQSDSSIAQLKTAVRLAPRDERARLALVDVLTEADRLSEAETVVRETIDTLPESGQAHWKAGRLFQRLHKDAEALQAFERAAAFRTLASESRLHEALARLYLSAPDLERSREAFSRAVRVDPNNPDLHRQLGDVLRKLGRQDAALLEFLTAALINPQDAAAHVGAGQTLLDEGRHAAAVTAFKQAVALKPGDIEARYGLVTALMRSGEVEAGTRELDVYRRLQADALVADRRRYEISQLKIEAALVSREGDEKREIELWQKIVKAEPELAANHITLGRVLSRAGRHDVAIEAFREALKLDMEPVAHRYIAAELEKLGRTEESERERATYVRLKQEQLGQAAR